MKNAKKILVNSNQNQHEFNKLIDMTYNIRKKKLNYESPIGECLETSINKKVLKGIERIRREIHIPDQNTIPKYLKLEKSYKFTETLNKTDNRILVTNLFNSRENSPKRNILPRNKNKIRKELEEFKKYNTKNCSRPMVNLDKPSLIIDASSTCSNVFKRILVKYSK